MTFLLIPRPSVPIYLPIPAFLGPRRISFLAYAFFLTIFCVFVFHFGWTWGVDSPPPSVHFFYSLVLLVFFYCLSFHKYIYFRHGETRSFDGDGSLVFPLFFSVLRPCIVPEYL
ncbi:hypothetical protein DFJ77DRAFT_129679 [Powellomyces hirtus]|nr:hypothetical protein DFJ77DRAFT_129679 [Powellomyces hirtus]